MCSFYYCSIFRPHLCVDYLPENLENLTSNASKGHCGSCGIYTQYSLDAATTPASVGWSISYHSAAGRGLTVIFNTVIKSLPRLDWAFWKLWVVEVSATSCYIAFIEISTQYTYKFSINEPGQAVVAICIASSYLDNRYRIINIRLVALTIFFNFCKELMIA